MWQERASHRNRSNTSKTVQTCEQQMNFINANFLVVLLYQSLARANSSEIVRDTGHLRSISFNSKWLYRDPKIKTKKQLCSDCNSADNYISKLRVKYPLYHRRRNKIIISWKIIIILQRTAKWGIITHPQGLKVTNNNICWHRYAAPKILSCWEKHWVIWSCRKMGNSYKFKYTLAIPFSHSSSTKNKNTYPHNDLWKYL